MFKILFTSDYEIHGNGEGSPEDLLLKPTDRTLKLFNKYGAKLTIFADVAEILKFREYYLQTGKDRFRYRDIAEQLKTAIRTGHDVQLHLHSSYCNARFMDGRWHQDYSEYNLAALKPDRISKLIGDGKAFLEDLLMSEKPDYKCTAFRAANWSMYPTGNIAGVLCNLDFSIDSSVFKWGKRDNGLVAFDYRNACSDLIPWQFDTNDVCLRAEGTNIFEFPIYTELCPFWNFFSFNRLFRLFLSSRYSPLVDNPKENSNTAIPFKNRKITDSLKTLFIKQPRKMDYNQCSGRQLIRSLKRIERCYGIDRRILPVVLIGHSKLFTRLNAMSIEPFLAYIASNPGRYLFGTFGQFDLNSFRY